MSAWTIKQHAKELDETGASLEWFTVLLEVKVLNNHDGRALIPYRFTFGCDLNAIAHVSLSSLRMKKKAKPFLKESNKNRNDNGGSMIQPRDKNFKKIEIEFEENHRPIVTPF